MQKLKVFISVPMHERENADIEESLNKIKRFVCKELYDEMEPKNIEFVDNFTTYEVPDGTNEKVYQIAKAIEKMSECSVFVFPNISDLKGYLNIKYNGFFGYEDFYRGIYIERMVFNKYLYCTNENIRLIEYRADQAYSEKELAEVAVMCIRR